METSLPTPMTARVDCNSNYPSNRSNHLLSHGLGLEIPDQRNGPGMDRF